MREGRRQRHGTHLVARHKVGMAQFDGLDFGESLEMVFG